MGKKKGKEENGEQRGSVTEGREGRRGVGAAWRKVVSWR